MAARKHRITREEALSFLLTHIVVERQTTIHLDQVRLFKLSNVAMTAVEQINKTDGIIPHEVIESLAAEFLDEHEDSL